MAMTPPTPPTAAELWIVIKKEITSIQLLWETVNGLYFQPLGKDWRALQADAPMLFHLTQTALMESLLMRVSRLMDPAATGKRSNLSLKQLVTAEARIDADEVAIRAIWDGSGLKTVRDKYLSHNDLNRSLNSDHTLNIPLESADIEALRQLAEGLRTLRRDVNPKLGGDPYVDQGLDAQVADGLNVLTQSLRARNHFYELFAENPESQCLTNMLNGLEHG